MHGIKWKEMAIQDIGKLHDELDISVKNDEEVKKKLLRDNNSIKGHNICKYLDIKIPHKVLSDVRQPDGTTMAI